MPTSGTHITIVQRIASDPKYQQLLGNPDPALAETDPEAVTMRFANLGAFGPDIFYAPADYGSELQALENFLMKVVGSFQCAAALTAWSRMYLSEPYRTPGSSYVGQVQISCRKAAIAVGG